MNILRRRRRGLTLIELLVVLFILAALAGVAVGTVSNFQKKTHGSTSANSIRSADQAITAELITAGQLGDNFDALITAAGVVPDYVANANGLVPFDLSTDADAAPALGELGITTIHPAAADTLVALAGNATLEGHNYAATIDVSAGADNIAALAPGAVTQTELNFNLATGQFDQIFAFGLGERATLVGLNRAFKEAPLHTPGEGSAATTYGRYAILVGYETGGEAQFIGVTCIDDGENFNNVNRNLGEFFEASN